MTTETWTPDKLRREFKTRQDRAFVIHRTLFDQWQNLNEEALSRIDGDMAVQTTPHEIVIVNPRFKPRTKGRMTKTFFG